VLPLKLAIEVALYLGVRAPDLEIEYDDLQTASAAYTSFATR
jgi:hypothetical protein